MSDSSQPSSSGAQHTPSIQPPSTSSDGSSSSNPSIIQANGFSHVCTICELRFETYRFYVIHRLQHPRVQRYQCMGCYEAFITRKDLDEHVIRHLDTYNCPVCDKSIVAFVYADHMSMHDQAHLVFCRICGAAFLTMCKLNNHYLNEHGDTSGVCHICGMKFDTRFDLHDHLEQSHDYSKLEPDFKVQWPSDKLSLQCPTPDCWSRFADRTNLYQHIVMKHYSCFYCDEVFKSHAIYVTHMQRHKIPLNFCHVCAVHFASVIHFNRHFYIHHCNDQSHFQCHVCGKKCFERKELDSHMLIHFPIDHYDEGEDS